MSGLDPELRRRVAQARVARLATVRPDGHPHVVPITFALDGDVIVTAVDDKPKSTSRLQRLENLEALPAASVLVDHYDDDWSQLWWVRADGRADIMSGGRARDQALARLAGKYRPYRDHAPEGPVIAVSVIRWSYWSPLK